MSDPLRRRRLRAIAVAALTGTFVAAVIPMASAAQSATTPTPPVTLAVVSMSPLPANATASQLSAFTVTTASFAGAAEVTAETVSLPGGFKLQNPGIRRSDYVYDSDTVYLGTYSGVSPNFKLQAEVTAQLHEVAIGGSSHAWQLKANMEEYSNPANLYWSYSASYWCGVNVSLGRDTVCPTNLGAAPSSASMSLNTIVNKPWGSQNSITTYPEVQMSVIFSNGVTVTMKFRGWDTLSRTSTTKLNTSSDGRA